MEEPNVKSQIDIKMNIVLFIHYAYGCKYVLFHIGTKIKDALWHQHLCWMIYSMTISQEHQCHTVTHRELICPALSGPGGLIATAYPRSLCLDRCFLLRTVNPLCHFTLICDFIREGNGSKYKTLLSFFREGGYNACSRCCVTILSVIFITHLGLGLLVSIMPQRGERNVCVYASEIHNVLTWVMRSNFSRNALY